MSANVNLSSLQITFQRSVSVNLLIIKCNLPELPE